MTTETYAPIPVATVSPADGARQREAAARGAEEITRFADPDTPATMAVDGHHVELPPEVVQAVSTILLEISRGHRVMVATVEDEEVSTSEAARVLGVSRPHVAKLIDAGIIPGRRVENQKGSHRRVRLVDVLLHRDETRRRRYHLRKTQEAADALDLYDDLPPRAP